MIHGRYVPYQEGIIDVDAWTLAQTADNLDWQVTFAQAYGDARPSYVVVTADVVDQGMIQANWIIA